MHSYIPDPIVTGGTNLLPRSKARWLGRLPCNSETMGSNPTQGRTQGFDLYYTNTETRLVEQYAFASPYDQFTGYYFMELSPSDSGGVEKRGRII